MNPFKNRRFILTLLLVLMMVLAACEDDDDGDGDPTARPTTAQAATEEATEEAVATEAAATEEAVATEEAAATTEATEEAVATEEAAADATEVVEVAAATEEAVATEEVAADATEVVEVAAATEEAIATEEAVATEVVEIVPATEEAATAEATEEVFVVTEEAATEVAVAATEEAVATEAAATEEVAAPNVTLTAAADLIDSAFDGEATEAAATEEPAMTATEEASATEVPVADATEEASTSGAAGDLGTEDNPIVLLFIPSENAQEVQAGADDLAALISEQTGLVIEARVSTDFAAAIEAMCSGEAEIGALNTFSYILAHERGCADVGVVSTRFGSAFYQGQIITSADSGIEDYADLAGTTFCRPDPLSTSGWIVPSIALRANGVDPDADLEVVDVGGHDAVVTAVYNGECQAGATFVDARSQVADELTDVNEKVVVIAESAPIPNDTLSFSAEVPTEVREAVVAALVEIAADEENLALLDAVYSWGGVEPAEDSFFDDFRQQLDAAGIDIEDLQ